MSNLEEIVYKHALINAVKHKGKASNGAVMGSVMATHAELRSEAKKIAQIAAELVLKVNSMDPDLQKSELDKLGGMKEKKPVEEKGLVDLPDVKGKVVLKVCSKSIRPPTYRSCKGSCT